MRDELRRWRGLFAGEEGIVSEQMGKREKSESAAGAGEELPPGDGGRLAAGAEGGGELLSGHEVLHHEDQHAKAFFCSLSPVLRGEGWGEGLFVELRISPKRPSP
jgi:hypothetical protein